ncbi:baseplate hub subunit [Synechococcus phage S-B64]|uniref:Baseplate hub subunit n=2 Tax=Shandvirus TaxID=2948904 RepID=A0A1Z1LWB0_9CAUD|nr:baseplate hub [Synechococcus phage S-H35]YP_010095364.1 baseplate hub [Synechococcus phage S-B64]ARW56949.1 baseplate hub subunit [Synechococcus phage S-H35]AWD90162.1 baseplate hub subunit [Synechococcus phage S-B64]
MALPKLNVPQYNCKLPSTGAKVKYRPFLVKEEKLLFLAMETGEQEDMIDAVRNILSSCTDVRNVNKLATFDIEYLFLKIRASSVGESVEVNITCPDDNETQVKVNIPLDEIEVQINPNHKREIKLDDNVMLTMGYPSMDMFVKMNFTGTGMDEVFELAAGCAESIADENQVYLCKDTPKAELIEFFESMNSKQFRMVQEFFETMPKLSHTLEITNPNTKVKNEVVIEGLASFFE